MTAKLASVLAAAPQPPPMMIGPRADAIGRNQATLARVLAQRERPRHPLEVVAGLANVLGQTLKDRQLKKKAADAARQKNMDLAQAIDTFGTDQEAYEPGDGVYFDPSASQQTPTPATKAFSPEAFWSAVQQNPSVRGDPRFMALVHAMTALRPTPPPALGDGLTLGPEGPGGALRQVR